MKVESSSPRKQRQALYMSPLHLKREQMHAHLSKELRKAFGARALGIRTKDTAKVLRGGFKGKSGKVARLDYARAKVYLEKVMRRKTDGTEIMVPLKPSNLMLVELDRSDERRFKRSKKTAKKAEAKAEKKQKTVEEKPVEKKAETEKKTEKPTEAKGKD